MKFKKAIWLGFMVICLGARVLASHQDVPDDKTLYIGIRPWDENVQGVSLGQGHCVDFRVSEAPEPVPAHFHHLDVNDMGPYCEVSQYYAGPLAGKFSDFARLNAGKFETIIIDWMTYQHITRDTAWSDFSSLLRAGGQLVVPVTYSNFATGPASQKKAEEVVESKNLRAYFSDLTVCEHKELPQDVRFDVLRRPGITDAALSFLPAIIIAKK